MQGAQGARAPASASASTPRSSTSAKCQTRCALRCALPRCAALLLRPFIYCRPCPCPVLLPPPPPPPPLPHTPTHPPHTTTLPPPHPPHTPHPTHPTPNPPQTAPEIQRTSLVSAVLYLKSLPLDIDVLGFDYLDPPGVRPGISLRFRNFPSPPKLEATMLHMRCCRGSVF